MRSREAWASSPAARGAFLVLATVATAAAVYGAHVAHGGFLWDDWRNAATTRFHHAGFAGPFNLRQAAYEPGITLALPLPFLLFGLDASAHIALALALGVALSICLFALLREVGAGALAATAAALLAIVFPWSDSARLWATAGLDQLDVCFYLAGTTFALRGLRASGRSQRRLERASLALYAATVLTYPIAIPFVALSGLVYRLRLPWRLAFKRGRREAILGSGAAVYVALATTKRVQTPSSALRHGLVITRQWVDLLGLALTPVRLPSYLVAGVAAALVTVAAAHVRLWRSRGNEARASALGRWVVTVLVAAGASLLAYAAAVPGEQKYVPLAHGIYNRVGLLAGPAVAVVVIALGGIAGELLFGRRPRVARFVHSLVVLSVLVSWSVQVRNDAAVWDEAAVRSRSVLSTLARIAPRLPPAATVFAVHVSGYQAPGVPVFASSFDLDNAVKLVSSNPNISGYPLIGALDCRRGDARPSAQAFSADERTSYDRVFLVDAVNGEMLRITSERVCRRLSRALSRHRFPLPEAAEPRSTARAAQRT